MFALMFFIIEHSTEANAGVPLAYPKPLICLYQLVCWVKLPEDE